ncbi:hypothetical protein NPIL_292061 [Nephila pilipes]|uniref:Uncharacterized protein n=1 Tax=Nephila pilipes TaxID=299642 RepID=A0A8X6QMP5_NEPPI|nr:hypothetical protein NPIL_292061 [Nephila pilipes]
MSRHDIGCFGVVLLTEATGRSHKNSCQVNTEGVPKLINNTIAIYWLHCVPYDNERCHRTIRRLSPHNHEGLRCIAGSKWCCRKQL